MITVDASPSISELQVIAWVVGKRLSSVEYDDITILSVKDLEDFIVTEDTPEGYRKWLADCTHQIINLLVADFFLEPIEGGWIRGYHALFDTLMLSSDECVSQCISEIELNLEATRWL